jgi:hypothetical protein
MSTEIDAREFPIFKHDARALTPHGGSSGEHVRGEMAERAHGGDWSWKPERDKRLGDRMVTFRGVSKGTAETHGPRILN